jgi:hypothetical protein
MSNLTFDDGLGRRVRTGDGPSLGVPTSQLVVEALADDRAEEASDLLDYLIEETERVYAIFSTWLPELLAYGERHIDALDGHLVRLAETLGGEPPLIERATFSPGLLEGCRTALAAGEVVAVETLLVELREELRAPQDLQAAWCWALLTLYRDVLGEDRLEEVMRTTQAGWVTPRYAALGEMSAQQVFELTIEGMRGHLGGEAHSGAVHVTEDDEKWVMEFDPCGTGGRIRRGDPANGRPPAAELPDVFGVTEREHDWTWQEKGVCVYCAHCSLVNEILPIEHLGVPMRVTEYPKSPNDPCRWTVYKSGEAVPDEAYQRVGKQPPSRG